MKHVFASLLLLCAAGSALAAPQLSVPLHDPFNLYTAGEPVAVKLQMKAFGDGPLTVTCSIKDYWGKEVWSRSETLTGAERSVNQTFEPGALPQGYYAASFEAKGAQGEATLKSTFGVVHFNNRTLADVKKGNYRFGLKMGGGPRTFDHVKGMEVSAKLGLVWTRQLFEKVDETLANLPINLIYKVEGIPEEAYDEKRYGPIGDFKMRHFNYRKASVPLEEPYKKWLKEKITALPKAQNTFEIWNEAWGKVSPVDFAKVCQWTREVILEIRPDALIGPNLGTHSEYDAEFIAAGGMEGMNALFLHPYKEPERGSVQKKARGVRDFYRQAMGRDIAFFATEYGSPTPPEGERSHVTEEMQAYWNVRRSLIFYAEDYKGFMPHIMGQPETDAGEKEDWYGHFRANMEPKPALIALAVAAQTIDGSNYLGDLFLKPDVGVRVFERDGQYTLAMWTNDQNISVDINVGVPEVTKIDIVGKEEKLTTQAGNLKLDLGPNMIYLQGVSPKMAEKATKELIEGQWVQGIEVRKVREARFAKKAPVIDGKIARGEWPDTPRLEMSRSKVPAEDASGIGYVTWDKNYLYVAAEIIDNHPNTAVATNVPEGKDWRYASHNPVAAKPADGLELFVGSQLKYQIPEFLFAHDSNLYFSPVKENGKPVAVVVNQGKNTFDEIPGLKMATQTTPTGWTIEVAIPLTQFKEFPAKVGETIAFEMRIDDADPGAPTIKLIEPTDAMPKFYDDATLWSGLKLVD